MIKHEYLQINDDGEIIGRTEINPPDGILFIPNYIEVDEELIYLTIKSLDCSNLTVIYICNQVTIKSYAILPRDCVILLEHNSYNMLEPNFCYDMSQVKWNIKSKKPLQNDIWKWVELNDGTIGILKLLKSESIIDGQLPEKINDQYISIYYKGAVQINTEICKVPSSVRYIEKNAFSISFDKTMLGVGFLYIPKTVQNYNTQNAYMLCESESAPFIYDYILIGDHSIIPIWFNTNGTIGVETISDNSQYAWAGLNDNTVGLTGVRAIDTTPGGNFATKDLVILPDQIKNKNITRIGTMFLYGLFGGELILPKFLKKIYPSSFGQAGFMRINWSRCIDFKSIASQGWIYCGSSPFWNINYSSLRTINNSLYGGISTNTMILPDNTKCITSNASVAPMKIFIPQSVDYIAKNGIYTKNVYCEASQKPDSWDIDCFNAETTGVIHYNCIKKEYNNFEYILVDNKEVHILRYNGTDNEVIIPSQIENQPVTTLWANCFDNHEDITMITIPDSVISIEGMLCPCANNLSYIASPKIFWDKTWNNYAIPNTFKLETDIKIASVATAVPSSAYKYKYNDIDNTCSIIGVNNTNIQIANDIPFSILYNHKVYNLTRIEEAAFANCTQLTSIIIPENISYVGLNAFQNCINLIIKCEADTLPDGWNNSWNPDNRPVEWGYIEPSLPSAEYQYVYNDSNYSCAITGLNNKDIEIVDIKPCILHNNHNYKLTTINDEVFANCTKLSSVYVPKTVSSIGVNTFKNCPIQIASIPAIAIKSIPKNVLEHITINSGTTIDLNTGVFDDTYYRLKTISLSKTIQTIHNCSYTYDLATIYIEDLTAWCNIDFDNASSNPLNYNRSFYLNNNPISILQIPESITTIKKYSFSGGHFEKIIMPDSITTIEEGGFSGCNATKIRFSNNLVSIGNYAFDSSSALSEYIILPDSLQNIGSNAFYNCYSLTKILIPKGVNVIKDNAFNSCDCLQTINCEVSSKPVGWVDNWAGGNYNIVWDFKQLPSPNYFYSYDDTNNTCSITGCKQDVQTANDITSFVYYNNKKYILTHIGNQAFYGCSSLTSINIPNSVTSIGNQAFYGCSSLTSINIPNSVTSIGDRAFSGCSSLTSINIPNSVTSISDWAFSGCSSLTSINIPNSVTSISDWAFSGCSSLTSIQVDPNNTIYKSESNCLLTKDGQTLILGCKSSIIPNSVIYIGNRAFNGCTQLITINISKNIRTIGEAAFQSCQNLTSVNIEYGITTIGNSAFSSCNKLQSIIIPDSVVTLGHSICNGDNNLTEVILPKNITEISGYCFHGCKKLTSINIPSSVKIIGGEAFYDSGLTTLNLPKNLTHIKYDAFGYCTNLTEILIPKSVQVIEERAFIGCTVPEIHCEISSQPSAWSIDWNQKDWNNNYHKVAWNYQSK